MTGKPVPRKEPAMKTKAALHPALRGTPSLLTLALVALASPAAVAQPPVLDWRTQVRFTGPAGIEVRWYTRKPDGREGYSEPPLEAPGRYAFRQGAVYRLKLSGIPGRPGLELYPTLEVCPAGPGASDYLAHSAVSLELTDEDFQQVEDGAYLVKAIYLPGPQAD